MGIREIPCSISQEVLLSTWTTTGLQPQLQIGIFGVLTFKEAPKIPFLQESVRFYFNLLKELSREYSGNRRVVITAGNLGHSDGSERDEKGVASFHAYSVLQVVQVRNY